MENRIYFLGESKDFTLAQKLYDLVAKDLDTKLSVAVVEQNFELKEKFDAAVYSFGTDINENIADKTYTYSVGQSNADICGFNFQKRELSRSIDIFSQSFMGRVNIPVNSDFSEQSVLYCVSGFVAAGHALPQVLKVVNSKIS